jgi:hypothetical protein
MTRLPAVLPIQYRYEARICHELYWRRRPTWAFMFINTEHDCTCVGVCVCILDSICLLAFGLICFPVFALAGIADDDVAGLIHYDALIRYTERERERVKMFHEQSEQADGRKGQQPSHVPPLSSQGWSCSPGFASQSPKGHATIPSITRAYGYPIPPQSPRTGTRKHAHK